MTHILLIEDDASIIEIIQYYLSEGGAYEVEAVQDAESALAAVRHGLFDLILLDVMLPDLNGVELCAKLRESIYCPIIFISCVDDEDVIISALKMGGDDYLVKPFNSNMLRARIEANLRRVDMEHQQMLPQYTVFRGFSMDSYNHRVEKNGDIRRLSPIEFRLLNFLIRHPDQNFSLSALYERIWHHPSLGDVRTVMVHIHNLRKKIEDDPNDPKYLVSYRGMGYAFHSDGPEA
ncbi:MAG: response regulator transcription factor [Clostridia bacterium]|nr:response regulator transcription factor [Clostridia bacterium]